MTAATADRPEKLDPTRDPRCGTMGTSGYRAHRARGERPCEPCQNARWAADVVRRMRADALNPLPLLSPDLPLEVWRDVAGARHYQVSSEGRVRFTGSIVPEYRPARDVRLSDNGDGYLTASIQGRNRKVHRLVAEAFHANPHGYPLVRHLDGNSLNNAASNLAHGTPAMNMADAQRHGTVPIAQHGTWSKYALGCRCDSCRAAARECQRNYRSDPAHRAATRARRADPVYRAAERAAERARMADPEYRAARNAAARARARARQAALKAATNPLKEQA